MGKRSDYKKVDELAAWDLDKGCRRIVDQSTTGNRRLRDVLKKQARKRIDRRAKDGLIDYIDYIGSLDSETDEQIIERLEQAKPDSVDSWMLDGDCGW